MNLLILPRYKHALAKSKYLNNKMEKNQKQKKDKVSSIELQKHLLSFNAAEEYKLQKFIKYVTADKQANHSKPKQLCLTVSFLARVSPLHS